MRTILILTLFLFALVGAHAKEYPKYDMKRVFPGSGSASNTGLGVDAKYLNELLDDLSSHALNYPPQFDTIEQRQRAVLDVVTISGILKTVTSHPDTDPEMLLQLSVLNSIGHNLNIDGAANEASRSFQRLLVVAPSHPRGNYLFGLFLAGIARPQEAIPHLEKALAAGVAEAPYTLGMTYLTVGDKQKALDNLELYQTRNPDNSNVKALVEGIRNGNFEVRGSRSEVPSLTEADFGTYAIVNSKGQVTNTLFRISQRDSEWAFEQKKPDESWVAMECSAECRLVASTEADVQRFFNAGLLAEIAPACIHNKAFAVCRYSQRKSPQRLGYAFVVLTEKQPISIRLHRIENPEPRTVSPPKSGEQAYNLRCAVCHSTGATGAPRVDRQVDWTERRKKPLDTIYQSTLTGVALHAPRNGANDLSDDEVRSAVDAMLRMVAKSTRR